MRYSEPDGPPSSTKIAESVEEKLRKENEELRRQLQELRAESHRGSQDAVPTRLWRPSGKTVWALCLAAALLIVFAFLAGYLPRQKQRALITGEAHQEAQALPRVEVIQVRRSSSKSALELPGNIQPITEAPILARADGYIARRLADIGDRVHAGQLLAEIEAPELDEQVRQSKAALQQAQAALDQAIANLDQGKSDLELARVTAQRWANLVTSGSVSEQENDQFQAQYRSKIAGVHALEQAVAGQRNGVASAQANLARLQQMQSYRMVKAPFDGVITQRNVDTGALVNAGSTLMFRIAQTATLRTYVNVPQEYADSIHPGEPAILAVSNLPGKRFTGFVARTANALDPASRTLLVEVHVPNAAGALLPGMYAQVTLTQSRRDPPLLIPSDALVVRSDGSQVAVVGPDRRVHLQKIQVSRDYGDHLDVTGGIREGDAVIVNPSDAIHEGIEVDPVPASVPHN